MAEREPAATAFRSAGRTGPAPERDSSTGAPELIVGAKLRPPPRRSDSWIRRDRLLARLDSARDRELVLVDAPVGYGKTVLLADWAGSEAHQRKVAWLSLDPLDSDSSRFLAHLVAAIRRAFPGFGEGVVTALGGPDPRGPSLLSGLINELSELPDPLLLVLDDYHAVRGATVHETMARLLEQLPPTVELAIATRSDPALPLGRLRAAGQVLELRAADLAFDEADVEALLSASGVNLPPSVVRELVERLEGWPAGTYLAAVSLRDEENPEDFVHRFTGSHRHIADYLTEEVLRRQPEGMRNFLARTSIFHRFSAEVCDAVLERTDSRVLLDHLEQWNLFLVGLDDHREWYRYHHLFHELLAADLTRREPTAGAVLHHRAGLWFASHGLVEEAIDHMLEAGDRSLAGSLITRHWRTFVNSGRTETVRAWIVALGEDAIKADPVVALTAAWIAALEGEPDQLPELLAAAERGSFEGPLPDGTASLESGVALIRGIFGFDGFHQMGASLRRAAELESRPGSPWMGYVLLGLGVMALLSGSPEEARARFREGLNVSPHNEPIARLALLSELSLAEGELGNPDEALRLAEQARLIGEEAGLSEDPRSSFALMAMGQALKERGELGAAAFQLERAVSLRMSSKSMSPWVTIQALLTLAPLKFALTDREGARRLLDQARTMLSRFEDGDEVGRRIEKIERAIRASPHRLDFGQTLTERELAVLSLLPTRLSQREIGRELFLSLNTVKSHTRAIYRKLGVASRKEAVERAGDFGLL
jgi:LuxR family transcriptional regulator, maltose regulon positive regulatory protein